MRESKCLVIRRDDLIVEAQTLPADLIKLEHLRYSARLPNGLTAKVEAELQDLVIFMDDDGTTLVMKNRYGDRGLVVDPATARVAE